MNEEAQQLAALYVRLGRRCGPESSLTAREITFQALVSRGATAARWLVARLGNEYDIEVVLDVVHVLQLIGETQPVLDALAVGPLTTEARRGLWMVLESLVVGDLQSLLPLAERDHMNGDDDLRLTIKDVLDMMSSFNASLDYMEARDRAIDKALVAAAQEMVIPIIEVRGKQEWGVSGCDDDDPRD